MKLKIIIGTGMIAASLLFLGFYHLNADAQSNGKPKDQLQVKTKQAKSHEAIDDQKSDKNVNPLNSLPAAYRPIAKMVATSGKKAMEERINNEPITKEKELPFVMGFTGDIIDDLGNPHDYLLGNWSNVPEDVVQKTAYEFYKQNLGDIDHKLMRLAQLKKYAADYPLIEAKLAEMDSTFKQAKKIGATVSGMDESYKLYEKGVKQAKTLLNAFNVGQEL